MVGDFVSSATFDYITVFGIVICLVLYIRYNTVILRWFGKTIGGLAVFVGKHIGFRVRKLHKRVHRTAYLHKGSLTYRIFRYFDDMLVGLNLHQDGVTVTGLLVFLAIMSLLLGIALTVVLNLGGLLLLATPAIFFLAVVIFRLTSLTKMETREAIIMDAVDLLVSDVRGGIFNGIIRYQENFHPTIRPAFYRYIANRNKEGYDGRQAMLLLADELGYAFSDFANKAIMYEEKADDTLDDIFSSIIEVNIQKRKQRFRSNVAFNQARFMFLVSITINIGYGLFCIWTEPYIHNFLLNTIAGKIMVIFDIVLVAAVLMYMTSVKSKSL